MAGLAAALSLHMFGVQEGKASFRGLHQGQCPLQSSGLAKDMYRSVQPRRFFHTLSISLPIACNSIAQLLP